MGAWQGFQHRVGGTFTWAFEEQLIKGLFTKEWARQREATGMVVRIAVGYRHQGSRIIRKLGLRQRGRKKCSRSPVQLAYGGRIIDRIEAMAVKDRSSDNTVGKQRKKSPWVSSSTSLALVSPWLKPTSSQRARETSWVGLESGAKQRWEWIGGRKSSKQCWKLIIQSIIGTHKHMLLVSQLNIDVYRESCWHEKDSWGILQGLE